MRLLKTNALVPSNNNIASLSKGQNTGEYSPNSRDLKIATSPQGIQTGVTPDYALNEASDNATFCNNKVQTASSTKNVEEAVWFLMRVAYGRERKAKDYLEPLGIEVFLPEQEKCFICKGKRVHKQESLIPNFLFVKSTEREMKKYIGKEPLEFFHHYYVPHKDHDGNSIGKKGLKPLVIPADQMEKFIQWNSVHDANKLFVTDDKIPFRNNEKVRILGGAVPRF